MKKATIIGIVCLVLAIIIANSSQNENKSSNELNSDYSLTESVSCLSESNASETNRQPPFANYEEMIDSTLDGYDLCYKGSFVSAFMFSYYLVDFDTQTMIKFHKQVSKASGKVTNWGIDASNITGTVDYWRIVIQNEPIERYYKLDEGENVVELYTPKGDRVGRYTVCDLDIIIPTIKELLSTKTPKEAYEMFQP